MNRCTECTRVPDSMALSALVHRMFGRRWLTVLTMAPNHLMQASAPVSALSRFPCDVPPTGSTSWGSIVCKALKALAPRLGGDLALRAQRGVWARNPVAIRCDHRMPDRRLTPAWAMHHIGDDETVRWETTRAGGSHGRGSERAPNRTSATCGCSIPLPARGGPQPCCCAIDCAVRAQAPPGPFAP
jgi:hypothetical protein